MMNPCVIGSGSWGTAFAHLLAEKLELETGLWCRKEQLLNSINKSNINPDHLAKFEISKKINAIDADRLANYNTYFIAIPVQYMRETLKQLGAKLNKNATFVSLSKGIEISTHMRPTQIISDTLNTKNTAVLSGPSHAEEVIKLLPTSCVLASDNMELAISLQQLLSSSVFRAYTTTDVAGVESAGALKNVIAIASGISYGLKLGENARAALVTRGAAEIKRFLETSGARAETIYGLAGIGDLMVTCFSGLSRNFSLGTEIAKGIKLEGFLKSSNQIPEGAFTVKAIYEQAKKQNIELPISSEVYTIIYNNKNPMDSLRDLMTRPLKSEY